jgi:hypothetical protein
MARPNACTKAANGRYRGSRQQERPHRLDTACQRRNISSSSRRLPFDLKARRPEIAWRKVAGIGNVLRHNYESIAAQVM